MDYAIAWQGFIAQEIILIQITVFRVKIHAQAATQQIALHVVSQILLPQENFVFA
jgi:hypothetical protein